MLIKTILEIFQYSSIITFFAEYAATKVIDELSNNSSVERQLIDALQESLENFCDMMEWEYDTTAITDTFISDLNALDEITSVSALGQILENAIGTSVSENQLKIWAACFFLSVSSSKRVELMTFLNTNNIFMISNNIDEIKKIIGTARSPEKEELPLDNVFISLSSYNIGMNSHVFWPGEKQKIGTHYIYQRENDLLIIQPSPEWFGRMTSDRPITQNDEISKWELPGLDIKVANNSNSALFITDIVFKNIRSRLDPLPVLYLPENKHSTNGRHLYVVNEGWSDVMNMKMRLSLNSINCRMEIDHANARYTHEIYIGDVDQSVSIDLSPVLIDYKFINDRYGYVMSMKPQDLERSGDFTQVYGEFIYDSISNENEKRTYRVKFEAIVYIYEVPYRSVLDKPSYVYKTKLETECDNYDIFNSVSQIIEPKGYDRFAIEFGIEKSSIHVFQIEVVTNLGVLLFPRVELHAFIPRSRAGFLNKQDD